MVEKCPHHDALVKAVETATEKIIIGDSETTEIRAEMKHLIASNTALTDSVKELTSAVNTLMANAVSRDHCDKRHDYFNASLGKIYKHIDTNDKDLERTLRDYTCSKTNVLDKRISEIKDGALKTATIVTAVMFGVLSFIQWLITTMM